MKVVLSIVLIVTALAAPDCPDLSLNVLLDCISDYLSDAPAAVVSFGLACHSSYEIVRDRLRLYQLFNISADLKQFAATLRTITHECRHRPYLLHLLRQDLAQPGNVIDLAQRLYRAYLPYPDIVLDAVTLFLTECQSVTLSGQLAVLLSGTDRFLQSVCRPLLEVVAAHYEPIGEIPDHIRQILVKNAEPNNWMRGLIPDTDLMLPVAVVSNVTEQIWDAHSSDLDADPGLVSRLHRCGLRLSLLHYKSITSQEAALLAPYLNYDADQMRQLFLSVIRRGQYDLIAVVLQQPAARHALSAAAKWPDSPRMRLFLFGTYLFAVNRGLAEIQRGLDRVPGLRKLLRETARPGRARVYQLMADQDDLNPLVLAVMASPTKRWWPAIGPRKIRSGFRFDSRLRA